MKKFIYCLEEDKNTLIKNGLKFLHTKELGDKLYYVFENKQLKDVKFDTNDLIISDKMFF